LGFRTLCGNSHVFIHFAKIVDALLGIIFTGLEIAAGTLLTWPDTLQGSITTALGQLAFTFGFKNGVAGTRTAEFYL
jgi:hypothetical protein